MRIARSIAVLTVTAVAALGLTACSTKGELKSDRPDATNTSQHTSKAQDPNAPTPTKTSQDPANDPGEIGGDYASWLAAVQEAKTYKFTMAVQSTSRASDSAEGAGSVDVSDPDSPRVAADLDFGIEKYRYIFIGNKLYGRYPKETGDKFIVRDASDSDGFYLQLMSMFDLSTQMRENADAVLSVEKKGGPITIDGVSAQPYEVTLDASKIADETDPTGPTATSTEPATYVYTYYIDENGLPVRAIFTVPGISVTADYTDWGKSVSIAAPPTSQITEMPEDDDLDY